MIAVNAANLFLDFCARPSAALSSARIAAAPTINAAEWLLAKRHELMFYRKRGAGRSHGEETDKKTEP